MYEFTEGDLGVISILAPGSVTLLTNSGLVEM